MTANQSTDKTSQNFSGFIAEPYKTMTIDLFQDGVKVGVAASYKVWYAREPSFTDNGTMQMRRKPFSTNVNEDSPNYPFS